LEREVDWVIKQRVIQAYMEKNRLSWRDPKVSLMDLQYHDIRPGKGLYWSLVRRGLVDPSPPTRRSSGPSTCRPRRPRPRCAPSPPARPTSRARTTAWTGSTSS